MHAGKRLAIATCAAAVVAATLSAPAMADPGGLLSGVTQALPPVVAEPVKDVGATAEQLVEEVQAPVDETAQDVTGLVDETVSDVRETAETVVPAVAVRETDPAVGAPTAVQTETDTAPTPTLVAPVEASQPESGRPAVGVERVVAPTTRAGSERSRRSAPTLRTTRHVETAVSVTPTREDVSPRTGVLPREGADAPAPPQPRVFGDPSVFGGSVPQPPAPALLIALLLGLLALVATRAGGPRLHTAVALPHPADVRFRLVRPG